MQWVACGRTASVAGVPPVGPVISVAPVAPVAPATPVAPVAPTCASRPHCAGLVFGVLPVFPLTRLIQLPPAKLTALPTAYVVALLHAPSNVTSEEHTSDLQSPLNLLSRPLLAN